MTVIICLWSHHTFWKESVQPDELHQHCEQNYVKYVAWIIAPLPLYWRFTQCARRWRDTGNRDHALNMLKYGLWLWCIHLHLLYNYKYMFSKKYTEIRFYRTLTLYFWILSLSYTLYWNYNMDWGILRRKNCLRKRFFPSYYYYIAAVFNFLAIYGPIWSIISEASISSSVSLMPEIYTTIFAALEIIRRSIWSILRMENEIVTNTGKFRPVNLIPLPRASNELSKPDLIRGWFSIEQSELHSPKERKNEIPQAISPRSGINSNGLGSRHAPVSSISRCMIENYIDSKSLD